MSTLGKATRIKTPKSTAVREVAFEESGKSGFIYVVPLNGDRVYLYPGHRALFETVAFASSVGRAWREYLQEPQKEKGEKANSMTQQEFEEWMEALMQPPEPFVATSYPPSLYAW